MSLKQEQQEYKPRSKNTNLEEEQKKKKKLDPQQTPQKTRILYTSLFQIWTDRPNK